MALEIERRFLIKNDNWKEFINKKIYIEQGYLSKSLDGWIIRVRLIGKNSRIALKKHIKGFTNFVFERFEIIVSASLRGIEYSNSKLVKPLICFLSAILKSFPVNLILIIQSSKLCDKYPCSIKIFLVINLFQESFCMRNLLSISKAI